MTMNWFNSLIWKMRLSLLGVTINPDNESKSNLLSIPIPISTPDWRYSTMGPFMTGLLDLKLRRHLRSKGHGFFKINRMMEGFNANTIQMAAAEADTTTPGVAAKFEELTGNEFNTTATENGPVGAVGDGTILQNVIAAIKTFLESDLGKALLSALEKLLIGFLIP